MEDQKMQFVLTGCSQSSPFRVFAFDGVASDRARTAFTVKVDLELVRRYHIRLQDLPLLCRALLENRESEQAQRNFTYTEGEMSRYALILAERAAEALRKKAPKRSMPNNHGTGWRSTPQG